MLLLKTPLHDLQSSTYIASYMQAALLFKVHSYKLRPNGFMGLRVMKWFVLTAAEGLLFIQV